MAARRKVFRIEQSGVAPSERPTGEPNESRDGAILRELSALRALLTPPPAAPYANNSLARQDEIRRLASELQLVLAGIRGPQQGQAMNGGRSEPAARIADALEAVIQDSEIAAQNILAAAEHIDQAVNNLLGPLKGSFERGLAQDIREHATQIFEACNFQDLTSQQITKVRASFDSLDRQIVRALDALARAETAPRLHGPRLGDEGGHISQNDIDALFEATSTRCGDCSRP
jgi:chemotaxis protein CheZ